MEGALFGVLSWGEDKIYIYIAAQLIVDFWIQQLANLPNRRRGVLSEWNLPK